MNTIFYLSAFVAVVATVLTITRTNAVHALLYFITSLLSSALVFAALGAAFAAVLEVIVYAGAIMVLFIFVIMMMNLGKESAARERSWFSPRMWIGPVVLCLVLLVELVSFLPGMTASAPIPASLGPKEVGLSLFGGYMIAVELASMLLLAGLVGAYHLGRRDNDGE